VATCARNGEANTGKIGSDRKNSKIKNAQPMLIHVKKYGLFLSWQIVVVLLNAASGFVVIRALSKTDYAYYTIVLAVLSMFVSITSTGIDPALYAIGGKIWKDKVRTGILVNTALRFRRKVSLNFLIPLLGYSIWQMHRNNAPDEYVYICLILMLIGGAFQMQTSIHTCILRLNNKVHALQRSELASSGLKFFGVALLYFIAPSLLLFLMLTIWTVFFQYRLVSKQSHVFALPTAQTDDQIMRKIDNLFKANIVNTIYWSFQGQVLLFICAVFGTTENIGEVGALGRLALLLSPVGMLVANYLHPSAAKAIAPREILLNVLKASLWVGIPACALLLTAFFFPQGVLWILGKEYYGLENMLFLFLSISFVNVFQSMISGFCIARGWVKWYFLYTPLVIALQVILILTLQLKTLRDILVFHGFVEVFTLLLIACFFLDGLIRYKNTEVGNPI
jgi:hypothetical protein